DYLVKGRFDGDLLGRSICYAIERQEQRLELQNKTEALREFSKKLAKANQELQELAVTDGLTRIFNRRRFDELFLTEWNRLTRDERPLSLIMVDVDYFKAYNDTYGHPEGDLCLQRLAKAISKVAKRPADIVARYGGEEFVVALPNTDLNGAVYVAEAIRAELQDLQIPHCNSPVSSQVTISLGVASQVPNETMAPSQLLEAADRALYVAKEQGRDRIQARQSDCAGDILQSRKTLQWVGRLRQALEQDRFQLYAQPIQSLQKNSASQQFEILLRLCDQPGSICSPGTFLPIAEQYDFLGRIDCWVIDHLFAALEKNNKSEPLTDDKFYINLSSATCKNERFSSFIEERLHHYNLSPHQFCFEVSETVAFAHLEAASELTQDLRSMNFQVALDDFGSGTTSFTHLTKIPVDYVKIDGLFVRDIGTDAVAKAIVEAIHHISKLMNLQTIAEFVETKSIVESLSHMGVDFAQGYYFDRAKPLTQVLARPPQCSFAAAA
ncbi:MAG: EAL domain-containing protein, partial [Thermosynechococcaceae cyanobacterium]